MKGKSDAFSLTDVLFCLVVVSLIFTMAASLLASNKSESQRIICFNNLRQIGRAFQVWANDYNDYLPWQTIQQQPPSGGTSGHPLEGNAWWQYSWISNQLGSPNILVCPADTGTTRIASDWGLSAPGGFLNPGYRANALSYPLFLHALPNNPGSLLSGDRNFRVDVNGQGCAFVHSGVCFGLQRQTVGVWTNSVHGFAGHLLLRDGSVRFTTTTEFQRAIVAALSDANSTLHGLPAR